MDAPPHAAQPDTEGSRLPAIARESVAATLAARPAEPPRFPDGYLARRAGVFVTLRDASGQLRGCIGTLSPKYHDVAEETWRLAREAAFRDSRFPPVHHDEIPGLRFEISVVHPPEDVAGPADLDADRFGVVVSTPDGRRGALLPAVEGIQTVSQQLAIARRKGGIGVREHVRLQRFTVDHFDEEPGPTPSTAAGIVTHP